MSTQKVGIAELDHVQAVEMKPGIIRRTLVYNDEMMLCHFTLEQGVTLELHQHVAVQSGYVIKGKLKFIKGDGTHFIANAGTSYVFDSNEVHGLEEVCEPSEVIECFVPMRPEYA
jgi:quercetin dioxygenase-like cupin family protein